MIETILKRSLSELSIDELQSFIDGSYWDRERFWDRVDKKEPDDCWLWTGATARNYGILTINYKSYYAHRLAWTLTYGPIRKNLHVLHHCDQPKCVNPKHLFLGSHADNMADMVKKDRQAKGELHSKTKLTDDNVREIHRLYSEGVKQNIIAQKFNMSVSSIYNIVKGRRWKHIPDAVL